MSVSPRVGVITEQYPCPGGVQTCIIELIAGLNRQGIVPDIVWDEPTDWRAVGSLDVKSSFGGGRFPINSKTLRSLPAWLRDPLSRLNVRFARFELKRYDFVYCFSPGVRMPPSFPNVCWLTGPSLLELPVPIGEGCRAPGPLKQFLVGCLAPRWRPDPNSRYVTIADWIADRFHRTYGYRLPVIWPPVRERVRPQGDTRLPRKGFLFLSRLERYKNPRMMLDIAQRFPDVPVTIAGATMGFPKEGTEILRLAARMRLRNLTVVEDPTDEMISRLFESHSVFVFPAHWEHFGIVTVEAIRAGLLPLVHNSGGQREIVPVDSLRFEDKTELIRKAEEALTMSPQRRDEIVRSLTKHTERGTAAHYCAEMLRYLRNDLGLAKEPA